MAAFLESTLRGRTGTYTVAIEQPGTLRRRTVEIAEAGPLRWGSAQLGYSPYILPSFIEVAFHDPAGVIRETFNAPTFKELDYPVTITGPSFLWRGAVRRGLVGRPVAVRVHPQQTSLYLYDRLSVLKEIPGVSTVEVVLYDILRIIFAKVNHRADLLGHLDLIVTNATLQQSFVQRRFDGELAGGGRGDYGTALDQVEAICRSHGLMCFMNTFTGQFNLVHRASLPFDRTTATLLVIEDDGSATETTGQTRLARILTPDRTGRRSDEFVTNQGTGTITLEDAGAIDWIVDGTFDVHDETGTIFTYWATTGSVAKNTGTDRVITGSGGGSTEQFVGAFSPETDVRPRFRIDYRGTNVKVVIRLEGAGGTTHYLDNTGLWQNTFQEWTFSSAVVTTATVIPQSGEDFPEAGDLYIKISNAGSLAQWGDVEMFLVDGAGALIDDWTFTVGSGEGASITLKAVPDLQAGPGPVYVPATLRSELTGITFEGVNDYLVSDRLAQDIPQLDNLKGGVFEVVGPEAVLRLENDRDETWYYVGNGGDIDLTKGLTEGVWLALDDLRGLVGSGS